jgi:hypothetical protein
MCDITKTFTAIRKALKGVEVSREVPLRIISEMGLEGRDKYLAMKAYGIVKHVGLDYDEAYKVLGVDKVNEWIEQGTYSDDFNPTLKENLDYWCDPESRQEYYEEYNAKNTRIRRTGSMAVKLHPNFTIAEIEHAVRKANRLELESAAIKAMMTSDDGKTLSYSELRRRHG